jgi:hypothetical protein
MYNSSFISIGDLFQAEFQINVGERFVRGLCSCFVSSCAGCRVCGACTARAVSRPSTHHGERASNSSWFQLACGRSNQAHARCPGSLHPPSELQLSILPASCSSHSAQAQGPGHIPNQQHAGSVWCSIRSSISRLTGQRCCSPGISGRLVAVHDASK